MRHAPFITLSLLLGAGCAARTTPRAGETANVKAAAVVPAVASVTAVPTNVESVGPQHPAQNAGVPAEFEKVDFRNFSYPSPFGRGTVRLKGGVYERADPEGSGGVTLNFADVSFVDLTGDGKKEAVVWLHLVSCGVSCDGGSYLFYFYASGGARPSLLTELWTGSLAYGCGLKSFALEKARLTVEVFRECKRSRGSFYTGDDPQKFVANKFTRFEFEFTGRKFEQKKRQVFPLAGGDIKNYETDLRISDD